ncbi:lysophospholipid acyltransferase family protein [Phenylobacterium aquaticum]|uniref:lysophospholipid acyltransferase family protein n=1 Tax=Phenylobacterium aquaticum TaxID=1763816 RepID=UPI001F5D6D95|nr:lysophospholipid acyltransferase family protein [Phenylobacterium aquaticum]MCI3130883.1 1-acyl-sn-glycerol-3-phosphate acyltransferase [Phenylobacterium aquaticum]
MALWAGWTGLFGLTIPLLWLSGSPPNAIRRFSRVWARGVLALLAIVVGLRFVVRGQPPSAPALVVANHQSTWETVAALVLFPDVAIVTKRELLRIPVMSWYLRRSPMIVIDRDDRRAVREMLVQSRAALKTGRSVLIFPEGTRAPPGAGVRFKRGVEWLYRGLDVEVTPVAYDTGRFWPPGGGPTRAGVITVSLLPAIPPGLPPAEFIRRAEQAIEAALTATPERLT